MKTIVITGGPCGGKTSAMDVLRARLLKAGVQALFVPEAATDLITNGIAPWTCQSMLDFQTRVIALQLEREAAIAESAAIASEEAIVICDRGICDSHAYLSDEDFATALASNGLDETSALTRYDAIFHLDSVAKDDPTAYTQSNNSARFENAEEAAIVNERVVDAWRAHPHVSVVGNQTTFAQKADALFAEIARFIGLSPATWIANDGPILVSACLLGDPCRYDGSPFPCAQVSALAQTTELVPVCPEQIGGLPTPRTPSELQADERVLDREGVDRTAAFEEGARETLRIARERGCTRAILKSRSPSCGSRQVFDGTFSGTVVAGQGKTAALLAEAGLSLFDETDFQ